MRVLIAEDDVVSRKILSSVLEKEGFHVVVTCNGEEAWAGLQAEDAPSLAVLDWMMPGMDGPEVCRRIRAMENPRPVYIILLTGKSERIDVIEGLNAGADDYVTKPFDATELKARIDVGRRMVGLQTTLADRIRELESATEHIKTLQGIIPICMHCHKIRKDEESWERIESYIESHSEAKFSHSLCPDCLETHYPEEGRDDEETSGKNEIEPAAV